MVNTKQFKLDASRPLYAVVGMGDLAVEYARGRATQMQTRFKKVDLEPRALRDQARTLVVARVDELADDAKQAQVKFEARVADFQSDARTLPAKVESYVNEAVTEAAEAYADLATRGQGLVNRVRRQQSTRDAQAAAKNTVTKAKTARTQTTKSARGTSQATKAAAKNTGSTVRRNAKATSTSAKKTASAAARATGDAASKVGD